MAISENIYNKCLPAIGSDIDRCGSISDCNINFPESDDLTAIYGDGDSPWTINEVLFTRDYNAKACGVKQNGLYDLIRANSVALTGRLGVEKLTEETMLVKPFINAFRKSFLNLKFWKVTAGTTSGGNWQVDVENIGGNIPGDVRFFPAGMRVFISGTTGAGVFIEAAYEVVSATAVNTAKARLVLEPQNASSFLSASHVANPLTGVLTRGLPLVSQYESWCNVDPGLNDNQQSPVWIEENRVTLCESELFEKYHRLLKANNPRYREYGNIDTVKRNKQILDRYQEDKVNQWFYGKPLPNQNLLDWNSLETITVPNNGNLVLPFEGQCVGRRASNIGVLEQLAQCNRVYDNKGSRLNLYEFFVMLYNIMRARKDSGGNAKRIDIISSSWFRKLFQQGMVNYFNTISAGLIRFNYELGKRNEQLGFEFDSYKLDWPAVELVVASHEYFDDKKDARRQAGQAEHEELWIVDFADIKTWTFDAARVTNESGSAQEVARVNSDGLCIMKRPKISYTHYSETWANFVECPMKHAIIFGILPQVPVYVPESAVAGEPEYGYDRDT
jgi:hypothetical protein